MSELLDELNNKIIEGQECIAQLNQFSFVEGSSKLQKRIRQEIRFLQKFQFNSLLLKPEHLLCSNLNALASIVRVIFSLEKSPLAILRSFPSELDNKKKLTVDIVSNDGIQWIKVVCRKPEFLNCDVSFGKETLLDRLRELQISMLRYEINFQTPKLIVIFTNGVPSSLASKLESYDIVVKGEILSLPSFEIESSDEDSLDIYKNFKSFNSESLNLDITALVAFVSDLTNGYTESEFKNCSLLQQQRNWELRSSVKDKLDKVFEGKQLIVCEAAYTGFQKILEDLAGPREHFRATQLISRLIVVPNQKSERLEKLKETSKIKERPKIIFGTGDVMRILTVSANIGFIRAVKVQGIYLNVISHESRALTELKSDSRSKNDEKT